MEIERKFLVQSLPEDLASYPSVEIEQAYLSVAPVVRIRKAGEEYYLTYKGGGMMAREEYNLPLKKASYEHLLEKHDGNVILKTRYRIPADPYTVELDLFHGKFEGMVLAEVEFPSVEEANAFKPLSWFGEEVTFDKRYHNSYLAYQA